VTKAWVNEDAKTDKYERESEQEEWNDHFGCPSSLNNAPGTAQKSENSKSY
jgi:hypothetical protein